MYELTYILNPNLSETDVAAQADKARGFVNELAGVIKNEKIWEKRRLAYPIKKQEFGFYITAEFEMKPEYVAQFEDRLRLEPEILRHLLVSRDEREKTPRQAIKPRVKEKIDLNRITSEAEPVKEKVKIEEIDKRLEELLEE